MAPRTREQNEYDRMKRENDELKSQMALLGGLILGSIHSKSFDGLEAMIDHIPYLQTLPSFIAMRGSRDRVQPTLAIYPPKPPEPEG